MPLDPDLQRIADELTGLYQSTQDALLAAIADAAASPQARRRLRALLADVDTQIAALRAGTATWLTVDLPAAYMVGARHAAGILGATADPYAMIHREAVQAIAERIWTDLAATLRDVRADTRRAIRQLTRDSVRAQILEGVGPRASAELAEAILRETGAATVRYSNGARRALSDYADTIARTETAIARNAGEFAQSRAEGVRYVEVFDGSDCGWTSHNDPTKANGLVVPIDEAEAQPLAHPRCARSFSPLPDVTSDAEAERARRFSDDEQARMAAEERDRAVSRLVDGRPVGTLAVGGRAQRATVARAARTPRAARVPR